MQRCRVFQWVVYNIKRLVRQGRMYEKLKDIPFDTLVGYENSNNNNNEAIMNSKQKNDNEEYYY